ncbi:MAG: cell division protein FtsZ, partial [Candidatus Eremiobacterota bacterium]
IFGTACDETMEADVKIIVVATGFGSMKSPEVPRTAKTTVITPPRKPTFSTSDIDIPAFLRRRD